MATKHVVRVWEERMWEERMHKKTRFRSILSELVKFRVYAPNFATFRNRWPNSLTAMNMRLNLRISIVISFIFLF